MALPTSGQHGYSISYDQIDLRFEFNNLNNPHTLSMSYMGHRGFSTRGHPFMTSARRGVRPKEDEVREVA